LVESFQSLVAANVDSAFDTQSFALALGNAEASTVPLFFGDTPTEGPCSKACRGDRRAASAKKIARAEIETKMTLNRKRDLLFGLLGELSALVLVVKPVS